ncbi:MAG: nitrite reductase/ring-hydroxylating ferredoxin subunit [Candidatus Azotimanducaceae bacterium]|jgi:nitrite reductase/ring-hydroxylating ferredoxin subunit
MADDRKDLSDRIPDSVHSASTLPAEQYTSEVVFEREVERIFRKEWFPVARADQLQTVGDYLVHDFFGDEIIVVRDQTGHLNAFSNICLHRGCPILAGAGNLNGTHISCPYHKWAYELDGRLRGAPLMGQAEGFVAGSNQLEMLGLEEWQGWVFLNTDSEAKPLAPRLAELDEKLSDYGFADLRHVKTLSFSSPWNWKIMVENFMESYHHMGAHLETLNQAFPAQGTYGEKVQGNYLLLENPSVDSDQIPPFWAGCILPATLFALIRSNDTPYGVWYQLDIKSRYLFELKIHILVHESIADDADAIDSIVASTTAIHLEDIPMCEGVWKGVNSNFYKQGRLSHLEECLWQFYRYLGTHADQSDSGVKL